MPQLRDIAHDMRQQALRHGRSARELARGLELTLVCVGGQWTLTLARPATSPSEEEVGICRQVFEVPADATRTNGDRTATLRWPALHETGAVEALAG